MNPAEQIPLSLYVHLPWCVKKCPYCDFNSHALRQELPESDYVDALLRDLDFELRRPETRPIQSIFFGGGTPSLFSGQAIGRILDGCERRLTFASDIEITLEANPGTADAVHFKQYRAAGVNRLSIGIQSLDEEKLKSLGRIHDRRQAISAVQLAREAGFDNFNLDLMFALPNQSRQQALSDLRQALALSPQHLSWYHLTLEPNTAFAQSPPSLPDNDAAADMHTAGCELLSAEGFTHYETSAFCKPGHAARHNLNYWRFGDYLGIGAGAHSKRSFVADHGLMIERRARQKHPRQYTNGAGEDSALQESRQLQAKELPFEYCMNALRLHDGFSPDDYETLTGQPASSLMPALERAASLALVDIGADMVKPSARGRQYLNELLALFL